MTEISMEEKQKQKLKHLFVYLLHIFYENKTELKKANKNMLSYLLVINNMFHQCNDIYSEHS